MSDGVPIAELVRRTREVSTLAAWHERGLIGGMAGRSLAGDVPNKSSGRLDEFVRYAFDGLECSLAPYQEDVRRKVFSVDR